MKTETAYDEDGFRFCQSLYYFANGFPHRAAKEGVWMKSPSRFGAAALTYPRSLPQQMLHQDLEAHQDQHKTAEEFSAALVLAAENAANLYADDAADKRR